MVATAEKNVIANAAEKEESLNVQILVDKQTKDLKVGSRNPPTQYDFRDVMRNSCLLDISFVISVLIFPSIRKDSVNSWFFFSFCSLPQM